MTVSVTQAHWWSFRSPLPDRRAYRKAKAAPRDPGKNAANARRDRFEAMKQVAETGHGPVDGKRVGARAG